MKNINRANAPTPYRCPMVIDSNGDSLLTNKLSLVQQCNSHYFSFFENPLAGAHRVIIIRAVAEARICLTVGQLDTR